MIAELITIDTVHCVRELLTPHGTRGYQYEAPDSATMPLESHTLLLWDGLIRHQPANPVPVTLLIDEGLGDCLAS